MKKLKIQLQYMKMMELSNDASMYDCDEVPESWGIYKKKIP